MGREHVLDVKLRAKEVRAARLRLAGTAVALSFGTILGLYLIWRTGEWALDQFVYRNDAFAIRTIDIQTDGIIGVEQLRRWAGVEPGENLLALDLGRIKRDLELVPLIQSAAIDRVLPHSLRIRVVERAPVAQVNVPQLRKGGGIQLATLYLDEKGHVIAPLDAGTPTAQGVSTQPLLPLVFGFKSADLRPGQVVQAPNVNAALKLIMEFENSTMCGLVDLRSVDLSGTAVLQVTTGQESQITFGTDRLPEQLRRWRLVHDLGQKTGRAIRTLDLSVTNNSPVLWAEASAAPPVRSRSVKPARNRKKHV